MCPFERVRDVVDRRVIRQSVRASAFDPQTTDTLSTIHPDIPVGQAGCAYELRVKLLGSKITGMQSCSPPHELFSARSESFNQHAGW
jgi:hypothetical protein